MLNDISTTLQLTEKSAPRDYCIVVGDKYPGICPKPHVLPFASLIVKLQTGEVADLKIVIGEGVTLDQLNHLSDLLMARPCGNQIEFIEKISRRIPPHYIYTKQAQNLRITYPVQTRPRQFAATLLTEDACPARHAHVGGEHLPGAMLMEAARQMFMGSFMVLGQNQGETNPYTFAINSVTMAYEGFVIPPQAEMLLDFLDLEWGATRGTFHGRGRVVFYQGGQAPCVALIAGTGFPGNFLRMLETCP